MTQLAVLRHGPTQWNVVGRVQGRTDVPLSDAGREEVRLWRVPRRLQGLDWVCSPLSRTRETAEILRAGPVAGDDRLVEMDWAAWEGETLRDLRAELGDLMVAWEARGLDFRAPGGESPRDVQQRITPFLAEVAAAARPTLAVTHRGVIRALYALATGWDMTGKSRDKLHEPCVHIFDLADDGSPSVADLNIPLRQDPA